jgi:uncharacterized protein (DUF433 family)
MKRIASRIVVDQRVRFGKPVIKGTRVPVELVVGKLAGGMTIEEVIAECDLTRANALAAQANWHAAYDSGADVTAYQGARL